MLRGLDEAEAEVHGHDRGAGGGGGKKGKAKKKGSRSGNPAKRAQENAAIASGQKPAATGSAFGAQSQQPDLESLNLPKGFEKFLGK